MLGIPGIIPKLPSEVVIAPTSMSWVDWPWSGPVLKFQDWTEFLWFGPVRSGKKLDWTGLHQKDRTVQR
jgi:hypothetical protein